MTGPAVDLAPSLAFWIETIRAIAVAGLLAGGGGLVLASMLGRSPRSDCEFGRAPASFFSESSLSRWRGSHASSRTSFAPLPRRGNLQATIRSRLSPEERRSRAMISV